MGWVGGGGSSSGYMGARRPKEMKLDGGRGGRRDKKKAERAIDSLTPTPTPPTPPTILLPINLNPQFTADHDYPYSSLDPKISN